MPTSRRSSPISGPCRRSSTRPLIRRLRRRRFAKSLFLKEGTMRILRTCAAILILILGSAGFGQETAATKVVAVIGADGVQHVEITAGSYYFTPNAIVVKVNVPVELKVKKEGGTPHGILLKAPEAGIDFDVTLGKDPKTITFTPTKVGT